jgi:hypothetical protein
MILWAFMGLVICLYGGWLLHDIVEIVRNPELAQLELDIDVELWPIASKIFITITALLIVFGFKIFTWGLLESILMLR